jgi:hypothetical protein
MKEIRITCTGSDYISYKELLPLQGNIKSLPKKNKIALRKSIIENGFMAPIFIWNSDNGKYILDGHQRLTVISELADDGYDIPLLPVVYIDAETEDDAKRKILFFISEYGKVSKIELKDYIATLDISKDEFNERFSVPLSFFTIVDKNIYVTEPKSPIYTPTGKNVKIGDMFNDEKYIKLLELINNPAIKDEKLKYFLQLAATRFIEFNYTNIAEYYANLKPDDSAIKDIFEKLALVIIDYNKAIENGFVKLFNEVSENVPPEN